MAGFNPVTPQAQLGMVDIVGSQRPVQSPYDRTQSRLARTQNMELAENQDARAEMQNARAEMQTARAEAAFSDEQRQTFLNESALLYGEATSSGAPPDAVKGMLRQKISQLPPEDQARAQQMLDDPQGWEGLQNELKGRYNQSNLKSQGRAYNSDSAKATRHLVNPKTGERRVISMMGGQLTDGMTGQPITDPNELQGFVSDSTSEAGTKTSLRGSGKLAVASAESVRQGAQQARMLKPKIALLRTAAKKADFGILAGPTLAVKRLGMALNDLAGQDLLPVDEDSVASGELINAITPDLALEFTSRTKGAISDREMAMFIEAVPNLTQDKEGFLLIADVMEAFAERAIEVDKFVAKVQRENGGEIPYDIEDRIRDHFEGKPVLTQAQMSKMMSRNTPQQAAPSKSDVRQIGTSGGKPVFEDADGNRWVEE